MTTLHSLEIQGIRCFSPSNPQSIRFQKPLTLIVGQNGAGKTTIVECLKMATSGILPPNADRGKSFVHDSKLVNNGEVKAHIKLTVETYSKDMVSATRKYTIARDRNVPNKVSFKTGEMTLNIRPCAGEESTVSMKCTEMDSSVPSLMGLSRALIDSVIFCHQDENNWVLDDLSAVKARFDDLLETSRYTKALGALGKARKEQEDAIKLTRSKLEFAKCQIVQMVDIRNQLNNNIKDVESTKAKIARAIESQLQALSEAAKDYEAQLAVVSKLAGEIRDTIAEVDRLTEEEKRLMEPMQYLYEEGLEEMREYVTAVASQLEMKENNANEMSEEIVQLMDSMNEMHQVMSRNTDRANNRVILKEAMKSIGETLEALKKDIISKMEIEESEFNEVTINDYMEQSVCSMEDDAAISNQLNECKARITELENYMQELNTERSGKDFLLQTLLGEIYSINSQINGMNDLDENAKKLKEKREEQLQALEEAESQLERDMKESNKLRTLLKKLKNNIGDAYFGNKEELKAAIKFLESILNNDRQVILEYIEEHLEEKLEETDYMTALQAFFNQWLSVGKNGKKRKMGKMFLKTQEFQEDCANAVLQMIQHSGGAPSNIAAKNNEESNKPYNVIAKVATNTRIAEYIDYFKVLVQEETHMDTDSSYEEVTQRLDLLKESIVNKENDIASKKKNLEMLDLEETKLENMRQRVNEIWVKLSEMEARRDQYLSDINFVEDTLEKTKEKLHSKREKYEQLNAQIMSANKSNAIKNATIASLIDRYKENQGKLEKTEKELLATNEEGDQIEEIKGAMTQAAETIKAKRTEHKDLMESIENHRELLESLRQNITLKEKQLELKEARAKLMKLMEEMGDRNEEEIAAKASETNEHCAKAGLEIATLKGTLITREDNIAKLQSLLESDNYKYVQKKYVDTLIKLKAHSIAKEDLDLYGKTLEAALHRFHSEKIVHINSVLKRVWREVYTGTHIDYIEIKSSVDNTVASAAQAPKSYNYRMVMLTHNGTEMDMRGHSSAGERVLASLILRITLTETFCTNCNILTLDEPTTNLDKDNTASLEASLAKLVNQCSVDFQLVIITHDEPFARKMSQRCNCDMYYKITKNERNESVINEVPLSGKFMT